MRKVYFDLEATSTNKETASIFQIGAIVVENDEVVASYSRYIQPYEPISGGAIAVTGVSNQEITVLSKGITIVDIYDELDEILFSEPCELICHNIAYDFTVFNNNLKHYNLDKFDNIVSTYCTMKNLSYNVTGNGKPTKLSKLYDKASEVLDLTEDELSEYFNSDVLTFLVGQIKNAKFHDALWDSFCVYIVDSALRE